MIAKKDLEHGAYYRGRCRNAEYARWNANTNFFVHWRYKFGTTFLEEIRHPDDEHFYDVFYAEEKVEKPIEMREIEFEE